MRSTTDADNETIFAKERSGHDIQPRAGIVVLRLFSNYSAIMDSPIMDSPLMDFKSTVNLTFVGGGVLATSIIDGLRIQGKSASPSTTRYRISITARREEHARGLQQRFPDLLITTNNRDPRIWKTHEHEVCDWDETTASKHIVFISTQPQFTSAVCEDVRSVMKQWSGMPCPILVTMCPGITTQQLEGWVNQQVPIVRTMPNTPVSAQQGATALFANSLVSKHDIEQVMDVFRPISPAVSLLPHEDLLDVAASVSGSSPAYFFTLMEMLVAAAVRRGMPQEAAAILVKQSAFGSAVLAQSTDMTLSALRKDVCVPGGSTEKAISCLYQRDLEETVEAAVDCSLVANRAMGSVENQAAF